MNPRPTPPVNSVAASTRVDGPVIRLARAYKNPVKAFGKNPRRKEKNLSPLTIPTVAARNPAPGNIGITVLNNHRAMSAFEKLILVRSEQKEQLLASTIRISPGIVPERARDNGRPHQTYMSTIRRSSCSILLPELKISPSVLMLE